jgi:hypothetical protein
MKNPMNLSTAVSINETVCKPAVVTALMVLTRGISTVTEAEHVFNLKQQVANAYFSSTDASGCVTTDVNVVASEAIQRVPPDRTQPSSGVFVSISQFDYCEGTQLLLADNGYGGVPLADPDFQVSANIDSATLNARTNVMDYVESAQKR